MFQTLVSDALAPFLGTLIQVQTQLFLLSRARHFARLTYPIPGREVVVVLAGLLILGSGACGCATAVWTRILKSYAKLVPGSTAPEYYTVCLQVWLATSAGVDIILATIITQSVPPRLTPLGLPAWLTSFLALSRQRAGLSTQVVDQAVDQCSLDSGDCEEVGRCRVPVRSATGHGADYRDWALADGDEAWQQTRRR